MADKQIQHTTRKIYNWRAVNAGDVYGDWTITGEGEKYLNKKGHGTRRWTAICICGETGLFTSAALKINSNKCRHGDKNLKQDIAIGSTFGKLTVIGKATKYRNQTIIPCFCECGAVRKAIRKYLLSGVIFDCTNCAYKRSGKNANRTHAKSKSAEYYTWSSMKGRCLNPKNKAWDYYGGRGITVSQEWQQSFEKFLSDMGPRPKGASLDRIDVNKGYCVENCEWADGRQQALNKQANVPIAINDKLMFAKEIERETGLSYKWICRQRSLTGLSGEQIIRKWTRDSFMGSAQLACSAWPDERYHLAPMGRSLEVGKRQGARTSVAALGWFESISFLPVLQLPWPTANRATR